MTSEERSARTRRQSPVAGREQDPRQAPSPGAGEAAAGHDPDRDERRTVQLRTPEELLQRRAKSRTPRSRPRRAITRLADAFARGGAEPAALPFVIGGAIAAGYLLLALADGGFGPGVWSLATIVVWWTALVSLAAGAWSSWRIPRPALVAGSCLLGLALLALLSLLWASDMGAGYEDVIRAAGYLGVFVLVVIAAQAGAARPLLGGLTVGLVAVAALALYSRLQPGFIGGADEAFGLEVSGGRLSYPIGYWNALGAAMALAIPLLIWLAASATTSTRRALATAILPICSLTLFFSGSRGAVVATAIGVAVLIAAGPRRVTLAAITALTGWVGALVSMWASRSPALVNGQQGSEAAARGDELLVILAVTCITLGLVYRYLDGRVRRLHLPVVGTRRAAALLAVLALLLMLAARPQLQALDQPPSAFEAGAGQSRLNVVGGGSGRADFWRTALDALAEEPLRGIGAGGFESYWALHGPLQFTVTHAHSFFLEAAAELGIAGLLLTIAFVAIPAATGIWRLRRPTAWADRDAASGTIGVALAMLATGVVVAGVEWIWDIPSAFLPLVAAAAVLCAISADGRQRRRSEKPGAGRLRAAAAGTAIVGVGLVSMIGAGLLYRAEIAVDESARLAGEDRLRKAVLEARSASSALPFAAEPRRQLALVRARQGRSRAAEREIEAAQQRASMDWELWFVEAGIRLQDGDLGGGAWALDRARSLNPKAPVRTFELPNSLQSGPLARRMARQLGADDREP